MNKAETVKLILSINSTYPSWGEKRDLEGTAMLWQRIFADDDAALVGKALGVYISTETSGFAPTPGQLKEIIVRITHGDDEMTEQQAWGLVYKACCKAAYNAVEAFRELPPVCQQVVGSPEMLHDWAMMDADDVQTVIASNFMRSYKVRAAQARDYEKLPSNLQALFGNVFKPVEALPERPQPEALPEAEAEDRITMPDSIRAQLSALFARQGATT